MDNAKPYILITNDDGCHAKGLAVLIDEARRFGDVVVMAPSHNASGLAHSFTSSRPLRVDALRNDAGCNVYACDGTPVDCVKVAIEHFCLRRPSLVLSGINHGSNSSINILYSGTMGAVIEASVSGIDAIGFSLLDHGKDAVFEHTRPYIRTIIGEVLANGLPDRVSLNVNFPVHEGHGLKGIRVCRQSKALWTDSYEKRIDPQGRPYFWITGRFVCDDKAEDTDEWALENGYVSVVPVNADFTDYADMKLIGKRFSQL